MAAARRAPPGLAWLFLLQRASALQPGEVTCFGTSPEREVPSDLGQVLELATGGHHSCVRTQAEPDSIRCWGESSEGQLAAPSGLSGVQWLALGAWHGCALHGGGLLACWGKNNYGQAELPSNLGTVQDASLGWEFTCVVSANTVLCWGRSEDGATAVPSGLAGRAVSVRSGGRHACAQATDGALACWGKADHNIQLVPSPAGAAVAYGSGGYFACFLTDAGAVQCWGRASEATVPSGLGRAEELVVGNVVSCVLAGNVVQECWGSSPELEAAAEGFSGAVQLRWGSAFGCALGLSTTTTTTTAALAPGEVMCGGSLPEASLPSGLGPVMELKVGGHHSCARTAAEPEVITCWGESSEGQLVAPSGLSGIARMELGAWHGCVQYGGGGLSCWGKNNYGQATLPSWVGAVQDFALGWEFTCVVHAGTAQCWGDARYDQTAVPAGLAGNVASIKCGGRTCCIQKLDGALACWGHSDSTPAAVPATTSIAAYDLGGYFGCLLTEAGAVQCWGRAAYTAVPGTLGAVDKLLVSDVVTCALVGHAVVDCWGASTALMNTARSLPGNVQPHFGTDFGCAMGVWPTSTTTTTTTRTLAPGELMCGGSLPEATLPSGMGPALELKVGGHHSCVRTEAEPQVITCWGESSEGQLVAPSGLSGIARMELGGWHGCVQYGGGGLSCWGKNNYGQATLPSWVGAVQDFALGWEFTCVVQAGTAQCWGDARNDQTAVPAGLAGNVVSVKCGGRTCCVMKLDGALACWGHSDSTPASVPATTSIAFYDLGSYFGCLVTQAGAVQCWGDASYTAVPGNLGAVDDLVVSDAVTCALVGHAVVDCWGTNLDMMNTARGLPGNVQPRFGTEFGCAMGKWPDTSSSSSTVTVTSSSTLTATATTPSTSILASTSTSPLASAETSLSSPPPAPSIAPATNIVGTSGMETSTPPGTASDGSIAEWSPAPSSGATSTFMVTPDAVIGTSASASLPIGSQPSIGAVSSTAEGPSMTAGGSLASAPASLASPLSTTAAQELHIAGSSLQTTGSINSVLSSTSTVLGTTQNTVDSSSATTAPAQTGFPSTSPSADLITTTATVPLQAKLESLLAPSEAASAGLLTQLLETNVSSAWQAVPNGIVSVSVLRPQSGAEATDVPVGDTGLRITVPQSVVLDVPEGTAIVATLLDIPSVADAGIGAVGLIDVSLKLLTSQRVLKVRDLLEPIRIPIPVNYSSELGCSFFDEETKRWETDGVRVSPLSEPGEPLICETSHLTLFAAVWLGFKSALFCSQISILSIDALEELLWWPWYKGWAALLFWFVWLMLLLQCGVAAAIDRRRVSASGWSEDVFLVMLPAQEGGLATNLEQPQADSTGTMSLELQALQTLSTERGEQSEQLRKGIAKRWACCMPAGALRDCLDEIISAWFKHFSELRTFVEGLCEGLRNDILPGGNGSFRQFCSRVTSRFMLLNSARLSAASLSMTPGSVKFLLMNEALQDVLLTWHMDGRDVEEIHNVWAKLHDKVSRQVTAHMVRHSGLSFLPSAAWNLFAAQNPFARALSFDPFMSCKLRALFFSAEIIGSLVIATIFFSATGAKKPRRRGAEECNASPVGVDFGYTLGRLFAIGLVSITVAELPLLFLASLHTVGFRTCRSQEERAKYLRAWRLQKVLIWLLALLYLAACSFFICLFLASHKNLNDWGRGALISLGEDIVLVPLAISLCMPMIAGLLVLLLSKAHGASRWDLIHEAHRLAHEHTSMMLPVMQV